VWWVDHSDRTSSPVKLDFAFFPQGASCVQAYFDSDCYAQFEEPGYMLGTDTVRQQCMRFVYELTETWCLCSLIKTLINKTSAAIFIT